MIGLVKHPIDRHAGLLVSDSPRLSGIATANYQPVLGAKGKEYKKKKKSRAVRESSDAIQITSRRQGDSGRCLGHAFAAADVSANWVMVFFFTPFGQAKFPDERPRVKASLVVVDMATSRPSWDSDQRTAETQSIIDAPRLDDENCVHHCTGMRDRLLLDCRKAPRLTRKQEMLLLMRSSADKPQARHTSGRK